MTEPNSQSPPPQTLSVLFGSGNISMASNASPAVIIDKKEFDKLKSENEKLNAEIAANRLKIKELLSRIDQKDSQLAQKDDLLAQKDRHISKRIDEDLATLKAGNISL